MNARNILNNFIAWRTRNKRNKTSIMDDVAAVPNKVNIEYWRVKTNLGDGLGIVVCKYMVETIRGIHIDKTIESTKHLLTIGSIIQWDMFDSTVWGSGILAGWRFEGVISASNFRKLDIRAVRGPLTRDILNACGYECPEIYGDPAIIMPSIYKPENINKKWKVSMIIHHNERCDNYPSHIHNINVKTYDYESFIDEIVQSELIISSSLHGIILAETYGVPAILLDDNDCVHNQLFKYFDWYFSTNRYSVKIARTMEEALGMEPMPLPNLKEMREKLMEVFPYDLWD